MKKIFLFIALVASPVFAQEEEQEEEVRIEIESDSGVEANIVGAAGGNVQVGAIAAFPDKSVWFRYFSNSRATATYCWIDENEEPRCKEVDVER